jgi:transaldolase
MKIIVPRSSYQDLKWAASCGFVDGILVSTALAGRDPGLMLTDVGSMAGVAKDTAWHFKRPVLLSLGIVDVEELRRQIAVLHDIADQVMLEFPLSLGTVEGLHRAASEGAQVASMVFTSAQALLAAKAGAAAVLVHVGALESQGQTVGTMLAEMRAIFDVHRLECEIVAVRPKTAGQVSACAVAGADAAVVDVAVLRDLLIHPLTDMTLDDLLQSTPASARVRET